MIVVAYLVFLTVAHLGLMQLFRLTTYHRWFLPASPLLIVYGGVVAWVMWLAALGPFFLWHIPVSIILLKLKWRKEALGVAAMAKAYGSDVGELFEMSLTRTRAYFVLSSAAYLLTFTVVFLAIDNTVGPPVR